MNAAAKVSIDLRHHPHMLTGRGQLSILQVEVLGSKLLHVSTFEDSLNFVLSKVKVCKRCHFSNHAKKTKKPTIVM